MRPLPVDNAADVETLLDLLAQPKADQRGLGDHFAYIAAVHPEWLFPHQERLITELLDRFDIGFGELCLILAGTPDHCVELLDRRIREKKNFVDQWALAAIGSPAALDSVAEEVRGSGDRREYEDSGVWVPPTGPAQWRFTPHRRAVVQRTTQHTDANSYLDNPVGLPLDQVVRDPQHTKVSWHYVSVAMEEIPGVPAWPTPRIHLVSPPAACMWNLTASSDEQGRYYDETVLYSDLEPGEEDAYLAYAADDGHRGAVDLKPYDGDMIYCNGHILLTDGIVGIAGGPPMGVYPTPCCPSCGRLMFHVVTVENYVREYGDGWRSAFVCEDCQKTTCTATGWN